MRARLDAPLLAETSTPTAPARSHTIDDNAFLLEIEFDVATLIINGACLVVNVCWDVAVQADAATRAEVVRSVLLLLVLFTWTIGFPIGGRCYLQRAVRRQWISSRWARLLTVASLVPGNLVNLVISLNDYGLPPKARLRPDGDVKQVPLTPETFVFYFYIFSHLSAGQSGWRLAVRLLTFVLFLQAQSFWSAQIWSNLAAGRAPFHGMDDAPYTLAVYWTEKVVVLSSSLLSS